MPEQVTIFFAILFITILSNIKNVVGDNETQWLAYIKVSIQVLIMAVGVYLSGYLYSTGMYSFTPIIITTLLVSFTNIHWPYAFNISNAFRISGACVFYK